MDANFEFKPKVVILRIEIGEIVKAKESEVIAGDSSRFE